MSPNRGWAGAILLPVLLASCMGEIFGPERPIVRTSVRIQGTVVSREGGGAVSNAKVVLGTGGHFSLPAVYASTATDESGIFRLSGTVPHYADGCGAWVEVTAPAFKSWSSQGGDVDIHCTSSEQTILVRLTPLGS